MTVSMRAGKGSPGVSNPAYAHGHTAGKFSPTYQSWSSMHQRCTNPKRQFYHRYGGRGIRVCARWASFANFLADMGERPRNMTLDRIDNDGDYTPENCRWATAEEQQRNRVYPHTAHKETILAACAQPKTTAELKAILGLHDEPVKKFVRELRAQGLVTTTLVPVGVRGRTLLVKTCQFWRGR